MASDARDSSAAAGGSVPGQQPFADRFTALDAVAANHREIRRARPSATVAEAMEQMAREDVVAMPVWDEGEERFVGVVSLLDLAAVVAFRAEPDEAVLSLTLAEVIASDDALGESTAAVVDSSEPLSSVVSLLGGGTLRRVIVRAGHTHRLLTQTDASRFFHANAAHPDLAGRMGRTLAEAGLHAGAGVVHSVSENAAAAVCFRRITMEGHAAVAVVDARDGRLLAELSGSDVRGLGPGTMGRAALPVLEYLDAAGARRPLASCGPGTTVREAVSRMLDARRHRVWVVDEEGKPAGVVTHTDVLRYLSSSPVP